MGNSKLLSEADGYKIYLLLKSATLEKEALDGVSWGTIRLNSKEETRTVWDESTQSLKQLQFAIAGTAVLLDRKDLARFKAGEQLLIAEKSGIAIAGHPEDSDFKERWELREEQVLSYKSSNTLVGPAIKPNYATESANLNKIG